jgi:hypothetical protein
MLTQLVPEDLRNKKIPCRYMPLSEQGETIGSFYRGRHARRTGSRRSAMAETTIARLERENRESGKASEHADVHVRAAFLTGR